MKALTLFFFLIFIAIVAIARAQIGEENKKSADVIMKEVKTGRAYLVDVRTPEEYSTGHLVLSQNIDYNSPDFKEKISKLNKIKTVYLYCRSGNRSGKAVDTLKVMGFKSYYNIGGLEKLKSEGFSAQ